MVSGRLQIWEWPGLDIRWSIGAYAVPSFPKDTMSIRLIGALLCGAVFMLATAATAQNHTGGGSGAGKVNVQDLTVRKASVGSGGRKAATCCSRQITNAAAGQCICPPGTVQSGMRGTGAGKPKAINDPPRGGQAPDLPGRR
jgi:hypothetical protein